MKYTFVDTCFGSHHVQFDAKDRAWTSGAGPLAGWVDMKIFDETGDAAKAQGWSPFILDINGNGKRDEYTEPNQPMDAAKDMRVTGGSGTYAVMPNPADGSIWYTVGVFAGRGGVMRYDPDTQLSEVFNVPMPGFGLRGGDIDSKGVVWVSLSSGHIGSFDRSKCKAPLNGPKATGDHCPEGWAFYQYPGPGFQGIGENSAEASYYTWVDQHDTFGLGKDVPISTANLQDGFVALKDGKMVAAARALPAGLLRQGLRWPHRRSERRLEGPRAVVIERRPHALADGRRQGQQAAWRCISRCAPTRWRNKRQTNRRDARPALIGQRRANSLLRVRTQHPPPSRAVGRPA